MLEELQAAEKQLLLPTYERYALQVTGGEGLYLHMSDGAKYLDLLSGIGVNALGYGHPVIEQAIVEGAKSPIHTSNLFFHEGQSSLALRLTEASGLDRAFFSNSGTEAWEAALKLARLYAKTRRDEGATVGTKFLALEHSFHGRTIGSVATTHKDKYREPFAPVMPGVEFIALNDVAALEAAWSSDYCALLLESIQGEGGIRPLTPEFMAAARRLTQSTGALLVVDEIQAGFGRTGKWFGFQHYDVKPDIVTVAKPLAGGLPLGAVLCTEEVSRAMHPGLHGTTFGGGPLACRVAVAVHDEIVRANLLAHVEEVGAYFFNELLRLQAKHPVIAEVRGKGLMLAAELNDADLAKEALGEMMKTHHVILNRTSETVLRFLPPYILEKQHVDQAIAALDETLSLITRKHPPVVAQTGGNIGD